MTVSTVPELRQPPHDPFTLLLGGRLGWPVVGEPLPAGDGSLRLPRHPGSLRWLTEPSGSFGGLRPPAHVAVDNDEIWLLRPGGPQLLRFDRCSCSFAEVPCFGGRGSAPAQLDHPGGIALRAGHLFVCDTGNQRVQVLLLPQLVLSGVWTAPMEWEPTDVVVDERYRVHVVDPRNGLVHHFGWSGRYLGNTVGVGDSRFIAAGSDGSLYVAGPTGAWVIAPGGPPAPVTGPADDLAGAFPVAPFAVSAVGTMHLGPWCVAPTDAWFDPSGVQTPAPPQPGQFFEWATTTLGPLDSLIDECGWHRVNLLGDLPPGCSVTVETLTAQVPLSADELAAVPSDAWETRLTCTSLPEEGWDALVRSPGGRYLWVRLRLAGNGSSTPQIDELLVEFPRISLRRYLPAVFGAEPTSADFTDRLLAIFDRSLRDTEAAIDDLPALLDPHATPRLDWLASWIGLRPDRRLPESVRREIVANAGHLLDLRGTAAGLRALLQVALGLGNRSCPTGVGGCACPAPRQTCPPRPVVQVDHPAPPLVLEHFRLRRWFEAGASTLGDRTVLWGQSIVDRSQLGVSAQVGGTALRGTQDPLRDPFHVHAHRFTVFAPAAAGRTQERRRALEQLVDWGSPAHTMARVEYVEARMRIGVQSSIGLDTVVGRLPAGVTLGRTSLGPASVLDGDDRRSIDNSAVGTTSFLG